MSVFVNGGGARSMGASNSILSASKTIPRPLSAEMARQPVLYTAKLYVHPQNHVSFCRQKKTTYLNLIKIGTLDEIHTMPNM
jgi:hypothetical protein